jgi:thymidylate kinase
MTQQIDNKLIVFEGPDGIGKTTQINNLCNWSNDLIIEDLYNKVTIKSFVFKELNESDFIFKSLRSFIYSLYNKVSTNDLAEIIKINRYLVYDNLIRDYVTNTEPYDLIKGKLSIKKYIALCDRWNISTYCYLKAKDYKEDICLSYLTDANTVIPGLTIMLVGMNGATRTSNREANNNMFEDVGDEFNVKLAQTYIDFDTSLYAGKVVKINNDGLTKDETKDIIREVVKYYLVNLSK